MKQEGHTRPTGPLEPIAMPRNSAIGVVSAFFATTMGFALIWHIWWLAAFGFLGAFVAVLAFAWRDDSEHEISAEELAAFEQAHSPGAQPA